MKFLGKVRKHCLSKPNATEDEPWPGDIAWKVNGKIFAICGGDALTIKSTFEKQAALIMHPAITKAAYVGRFGWVRIDPTDPETLDLALDLIDESYEMVAPKKKERKKK